MSRKIGLKRAVRAIVALSSLGALWLTTAAPFYQGTHIHW